MLWLLPLRALHFRCSPFATLTAHACCWAEVCVWGGGQRAAASEGHHSSTHWLPFALFNTLPLFLPIIIIIITAGLQRGCRTRKASGRPETRSCPQCATCRAERCCRSRKGALTMSLISLQTAKSQTQPTGPSSM